MESFEFKFIEYSALFTENQQILTEKKSTVRHRENENLVEFSFQLQWQTRTPVYKVGTENSQNTGP